MNAMIMSFDPKEKQCNLREKAMKRMKAVESESVKSARKAKDKLHKACGRASENCERTLHRQKQNRMCMASIRGSRDSLVSTQAQSHALMRRGFGTSVPFIYYVSDVEGREDLIEHRWIVDVPMHVITYQSIHVAAF